MTDEARFLRTICERPRDDAPRLVFADWLEENGRPQRADFIRLQIDLSRLPRGDRRFDELWWRETEYLKDDAATWRSRLPRRDGLYWGGLVRGFVNRLDHAGAARFLDEAAELFAAAPVEVLRLREAEAPLLQRLLELP